MNYSINSSNIKGKEEISMSVWPSNNLEREFFGALFAGKVTFEIPANTETIIIKPCKDAAIQIPEIKEHEDESIPELAGVGERNGSNETRN